MPEYWIIDPDRDWIKVGIIHQNHYAFETFRGTEPIISPSLPDLIITASEILNAERSRLQ